MSLFDSYFSQIYQERWLGLKNALLLPPERIKRDCFKGHAAYVLDAGSIRAATALKVKPGDQVLDICAAPGGKSLILAEALGGRGGLIANELSFARRKRLEDVVRDHVPLELQKLIKVTGYDGNLFGLKRAGEFDRVLLDAPCSSERHLLEADPEMKDWKESRTRQLAKRQYSLLCSALLSLKPGGTLVYSTCSISPLENDSVVERLLERKGDEVQVDLTTEDLNDLEKTQYGFQILPDRFSGAGPIYFSRLIKK